MRAALCGTTVEELRVSVGENEREFDPKIHLALETAAGSPTDTTRRGGISELVVNLYHFVQLDGFTLEMSARSAVCDPDDLLKANSSRVRSSL